MKIIKRILKITLIGIGAIALLAIALAILAPMLDAHNKANPIRQAGYFKTEENHRVQTYWVKPDVTSEELLAHARKYLPFTYPNLAAAWYYDEDSTVPAVTKAPNMDAVWARIGDNRFSRPRFVYWRVADLERYHDCSTPEGSETLACKRGL